MRYDLAGEWSCSEREWMRLTSACRGVKGLEHVLLEGTILNPNMVTPGSDTTEFQGLCSFRPCLLLQLCLHAKESVFMRRRGRSWRLQCYIIPPSPPVTFCAPPPPAVAHSYRHLQSHIHRHLQSHIHRRLL